MKQYVFLILQWLALCIVHSCVSGPENPVRVAQQPAILPDYTSVTVPNDIAPLNFTLSDSSFSALSAELSGPEGTSFRVTGRKEISIPAKKWAKLIKANTGDSICVTMWARKGKNWEQYAPFSIYISNYPADYGLMYRLIAPGYELYSRMGIYLRELHSFHQKEIFVNTIIKETCMNCHAVKKGDPDYFNLHLRGPQGGTIIMINGEVAAYETKTAQTLSNCVYPYWHPSGRYIAYSVNTTRQMFPMSADKRIEVYDEASDIVVFDNNTKRLISSKLLTTNKFETFPAFSSDGKYLYFCVSDQKKMPDEYQEVRYALCRIAFHPESGTFGSVMDTLINAPAMGKSLTFPRPSPDGRFLMFTMADYGTFPIWHSEADLGLLNLQTGEWHLMDGINSSETESYHSWSSNSRWIVFSSRRDDGLYTRPFIACIDEQGRTGKPFLLPQKKPATYYFNLLYSFNIPEFITGPVKLDIRKAAKKTARKTSLSWDGLKEEDKSN